MIRCIAVDDERYAADIIAGFIQKTPSLTLVGTFTNVLDTIPLIQQGKVDLVFLDIQMPELTGIQFLKIMGSQCRVILTTAYPDYALEGYELDVVDYLMKPIAFDRFLRAVQKAQHVLPARRPASNTVSTTLSDRVDQPAAPATELSQTDYIFVKGENKHKFIKVNYADIRYIEGLKNYVSIYTSKERIVTYQRLADLQDKLPSPPFFRIHKSYIISLHHINRIEGNNVSLDGQYLPVSESYREGFYAWIKNSR